jgi:hypothetical protein
LTYTLQIDTGNSYYGIPLAPNGHYATNQCWHYLNRIAIIPPPDSTNTQGYEWMLDACMNEPVLGHTIEPGTTICLQFGRPTQMDNHAEYWEDPTRWDHPVEPFKAIEIREWEFGEPSWYSYWTWYWTREYAAVKPLVGKMNLGTATFTFSGRVTSHIYTGGPIFLPLTPGPWPAPW